MQNKPTKSSNIQRYPFLRYKWIFFHAILGVWIGGWMITYSKEFSGVVSSLILCKNYFNVYIVFVHMYVPYFTIFFDLVFVIRWLSRNDFKIWTKLMWKDTPSISGCPYSIIMAHSLILLTSNNELIRFFRPPNSIFTLIIFVP